MAHVELAAKDLSASGRRGGPTGRSRIPARFPPGRRYAAQREDRSPQPSAPATCAVAVGPTCKAHMPEPIKQLEGEE
jgi:hypothetical protein